MQQRDINDGWRRLAHDPGRAVREPQTLEPFGWADLLETERHREILDMHARSDGATRRLFEIGEYRKDGNDENWIVRWMLRQACRKPTGAAVARGESRSSSGTPTGSAGRSGAPQRGAWPNDDSNPVVRAQAMAHRSAGGGATEVAGRGGGGRGRGGGPAQQPSGTSMSSSVDPFQSTHSASTVVVVCDKQRGRRLLRPGARRAQVTAPSVWGAP